MLKKLIVHNFALIEYLNLDFDKTLSVITGETGSGKSLVLDALSSVLGGRCNTQNIRSGAQKYQIEALVDVSKSPKAIQWLEEKGFSYENGEVIIKKELSLDGKSRIQIGTSLAPFQYLKDFGALIAEIHRQNDQLYILDKNTQLEILDNFALTNAMKNEVSESFKTYITLKNRLEELENLRTEKLRNIDLRKYQIEEISDADLKSDEEDSLLKEENLLINGEKLIENYNVILNSMDISEGSIISLFAPILNSSEKITLINPEFQVNKEEFNDIYIRLKELYNTICDEMEEIFFSPERLDFVQSRIDLINRLKKKYGKTIKEILNFKKEAESELETLLSSNEQYDSLKNQLNKVIDHLSELSVKLSKQRRNAIPEMEIELQKEFAKLGMKDAKLQVVLRWEESSDGEVQNGNKTYLLNETGLDKVEFYFTANTGEKPRPIRKIASGGEISRVMLALKSIMGRDGYEKILIFDEIDSGIGGEVANNVGEKLKQISEDHQVILITHLQQIAAIGAEHIKVEKEVVKGRTVSKVRQLKTKERAQELAKMISGENITKGALEHAKELLFQKAV
ncbi:MAG: DNA repair protein RecN [Leptospiraceae bacterium]|nr:DNA repair protein RecN [Leptospiraceae bacterium]